MCGAIQAAEACDDATMAGKERNILLRIVETACKAACKPVTLLLPAATLILALGCARPQHHPPNPRSAQVSDLKKSPSCTPPAATTVWGVSARPFEHVKLAAGEGKRPQSRGSTRRPYPSRNSGSVQSQQ